MSELVKTLSKLGYQESEISIIVNAYPFKRYKELSLTKKIVTIFQFLINKGYSKNDIIKMTTQYPTLYSYDVVKLEKKLAMKKKIF